MSLVDKDAKYINALHQQAITLKTVFDATLADGFPNLEGTEVTKAVLWRMKAYSYVQNQIKDILSKRYAAPAADVFVETVLFYLKLYCKSLEDSIEVHSERQIKRKRGQIRPDISVWRNEEVLSIIECKTQLGWNRFNWKVISKKENGGSKVNSRTREFSCSL